MAEFVKKGALGGYKVVNAGYSDPECSHVILTRDEYGEFCNKLRKAEIDVDNAKRDAEHEIRRAKNEAAAMAQTNLALRSSPVFPARRSIIF